MWPRFPGLINLRGAAMVRVIVNIVPKDIFSKQVKATLDSRPEVSPGFGNTDSEAIGCLVANCKGQIGDIFGIELVSGQDEPAL